jgi:outer membrane protein TolC
MRRTLQQTRLEEPPPYFYLAARRIVVTGPSIGVLLMGGCKAKMPAELTYKQTVQQALGDVANSLVGYTKSRAFRSKLEEQTATYAETARLANDRYRGGATSFLEVLTTQQQYLKSELQTSQARLAELQNYAQLYQAPGGGWQE